MTGRRIEHRDLVGRMVRDIRLRQGVTQIEVADRLGRPQSFVSKLERGEVGIDPIGLHEVLEALGADFVGFARRLDRALKSIREAKPDVTDRSMWNT